MISAKQGAGKSTCAENVTKLAKNAGYFPTVVKFADPLYRMQGLILPLFKEYGWRPEDWDKDGPLLQELGLFCRKTFGEDCFLNVARQRVTNWFQNTPLGIVIVDDCRFENEFDGFYDAYRVRLECLEEVRRLRTHCWRPNTQHPSEIGLDLYDQRGKFDLKWNTEFATPKTVAEGIWAAWLTS